MKDVISRENIGERDYPSPGIFCLDHGFVKLIDCMPRLIPNDEESADHAIAEAARCSYQRGTKTMADDRTLIRYLMRHNHTSPLEMVEFKFHMKLPLFLARQMVRHRTANINELSGRYSEMPEEYYIPELDDFRNQSVTNTQGSEGFIEEAEAMALMKEMQELCGGTFTKYYEFLKKGLVREQSRMVLPLNTYTEWYWKIDLKNLLHFLNLRCDDHAQKEIRVYGDAILKLIRCVVPWTIDAWEDYSPYRGGMLLTRYEVEAIKKIIDATDRFISEDLSWFTALDVDSKFEQREWKEKAMQLGFYDRFTCDGKV